MGITILSVLLPVNKIHAQNEKSLFKWFAPFTSSLVHQSKGVNLTQSRLELDNLLKQRQSTLETIDKKNEDGISDGTKVILHFNEELS